MPTRDEVLAELDRRLGPVAVMDLVGRDLVATPPAAELAPVHGSASHRLRGVLTGAAIGDALGRPVRDRPSRQIAAQHGQVRDYVPWSGWRGGPVGTVLAEGQELLIYARAVVDDRSTPWARFAACLPPALPTLRDPGPATIDACRRIAQGTPWLAAGADSFGAAGILRSTVDVLAHPGDPVRRAASASLGALVTHAHRRAVVSSAVAADAIAMLALEPARAADPMGFSDRLATALSGAALAVKLRTLATRLHNCEPEAEPVLVAALAWVLTAPDAESALVGRGAARRARRISSVGSSARWLPRGGVSTASRRAGSTSSRAAASTSRSRRRCWASNRAAPSRRRRRI